MIHDLKRNRIQYVGKGREAGYEAADHTAPKLGNREKWENGIELQNLKPGTLPCDTTYSTDTPFFKVS